MLYERVCHADCVPFFPRITADLSDVLIPVPDCDMLTPFPDCDMVTSVPDCDMVTWHLPSSFLMIAS